ncbi:hypothetical protein [uncultured Vagococcus sp.]|uniref:hypothetical protein n=1 Tax=uncultured Vagococcus sp. TaxID=189676 RepID=UPI0028D83498|nr:hypothetical protein [uncultured Vagococcus sp.]
MTNLLRDYLQVHYSIGVEFDTRALYVYFKQLNYTQSQIGAGLNNLKKKGELSNRPNLSQNVGYNPNTGKQRARIWKRLV